MVPTVLVIKQLLVTQHLHHPQVLMYHLLLNLYQHLHHNHPNLLEDVLAHVTDAAPIM
jgi:hypothetical protein